MTESGVRIMRNPRSSDCIYGDGVEKRSGDGERTGLVRLVAAVILVLIGRLWIGQGIGVVKGSFMTGEAVWAVAGVVAIMFGIALLKGAKRARDGERN